MTHYEEQVDDLEFNISLAQNIRNTAVREQKDPDRAEDPQEIKDARVAAINGAITSMEVWGRSLSELKEKEAKRPEPTTVKPPTWVNTGHSA